MTRQQTKGGANGLWEAQVRKLCPVCGCQYVSLPGNDVARDHHGDWHETAGTCYDCRDACRTSARLTARP